jgi:hypothetical protein
MDATLQKTADAQKARDGLTASAHLAGLCQAKDGVRLFGFLSRMASSYGCGHFLRPFRGLAGFSCSGAGAGSAACSWASS